MSTRIFIGGIVAFLVASHSWGQGPPGLDLFDNDSLFECAPIEISGLSALGGASSTTTANLPTSNLAVSTESVSRGSAVAQRREKQVVKPLVRGQVTHSPSTGRTSHRVTNRIPSSLIPGTTQSTYSMESPFRLGTPHLTAPKFPQSEQSAVRQIGSADQVEKTAEALANGQYPGPMLHNDDSLREPEQPKPTIKPPGPLLSTALPNRFMASQLNSPTATTGARRSAAGSQTKARVRQANGIPSAPKILIYPVRRGRVPGGGGGGCGGR